MANCKEDCESFKRKDSCSDKTKTDPTYDSESDDSDDETTHCSKALKKSGGESLTEADFIAALNRDYDLDFHMLFGIDLKYDYGDDDDCDDLQLPAAKDCVYTSCFCEENVWMLCNHVRKHQPQNLDYVYAVFISNENKYIPLWEQKAGRGNTHVVFWDYHVILVYRKNNRCAVYDLDSCLPFPSDFRLYAGKAIRTNRKIPLKYHRKVRVIPAAVYLETLSSDRSHMKNNDGSWVQKPPSYPCILTHEVNNLKSFVSMKSRTGYGQVMSIQKFFKEFMPPTKKPKN